jgi:cell wall-associated NlpC family hydrolase
MPATRRGQRFVALPFLLITTLVATVLLAGPAEAQKSPRERKIAHAVAVAVNQKGDPYRYGAAGPNAFDCSGLTMFSFAKAGLSLPRVAADQYRRVRHIPQKNAKRGDLVFFHSGGSVYHMGIFAGRAHGKRYILHAPNSGTVVRRDPIWTGSWYAGTLRRR